MTNNLTCLDRETVIEIEFFIQVAELFVFDRLPKLFTIVIASRSSYASVKNIHFGYQFFVLSILPGFKLELIKYCTKTFE